MESSKGDRLREFDDVVLCSSLELLGNAASQRSAAEKVVARHIYHLYLPSRRSKPSIYTLRHELFFSQQFEQCEYEVSSYFVLALGAIDGTQIAVVVSVEAQTEFRNRKTIE